MEIALEDFYNYSYKMKVRKTKMNDLKNKMNMFETMINTADDSLAEELIAADAAFCTPVSPEPLYGGKGYLSVVHWMRQGFSDVQWAIKDIVAEGNKVAVMWSLTGTHNGDFLGQKATGNKLNITVMNIYYFNDEGKIVNDIAAEGILGIFKAAGLAK